MTGFLQGLREGISGNLSVLEAAALLVLAVLVWLARKRFPMLPAIYSVFLVLYLVGCIHSREVQYLPSFRI